MSHRDANTGRRSVRQVPIQGPDAEGCVYIPPIREAGILQTLKKDEGPLVILRLGATEDPSGSP